LVSEILYSTGSIFKADSSQQNSFDQNAFRAAAFADEGKEGSNNYNSLFPYAFH
jgi:hypothetical protein